jgi:hypothetical protein
MHLFDCSIVAFLEDHEAVHWFLEFWDEFVVATFGDCVVHCLALGLKRDCEAFYVVPPLDGAAFSHSDESLLWVPATSSHLLAKKKCQRNSKDVKDD